MDDEDERETKSQVFQVEASDTDRVRKLRKKKKKTKRRDADDRDKDEDAVRENGETEISKKDEEKADKTREEFTCSKFIAHVRKTFSGCNCNDVKEIIDGVDDGIIKDKNSSTKVENHPECDSAERNTYASRKTIAKGLLDVALLTQNAKQLKDLLVTGPSHTHYTLVLILIITSLCLQSCVAVLLLILGALDFDKSQKHNNRLNNVSTGLAMAITIVNVFIAIFDVKNEVGC